MRIVVLGAGVIGTCIAYELASDGHDVTVLDRQPGPALETSFANAGEITPGDATPWAGPGVPLQALRWLVARSGPLVLRPRLDARLWRWLAAVLRNCTAGRHLRNRRRMQPLAAYSRERLQHLRETTGIVYDERTLGTVQLCRTQRQLDASGHATKLLDEFGVPYELLDRDGVVAAEPGLAAARERFAGGLRLPGDETGDCFQFTNRLAELAAARGAVFRFDTRIDRVATRRGRVTAVATNRGPFSADVFVAALGSYTPTMLQPLGVRVPVYPVKGYSITVPVADPAAAPVSTVLDETHMVAITRLGDRIRAGGIAELAGWDLALRPERREALERVVGELFPQGGALGEASFWCGLRPMTPDGVPLVGPTRVPNLYVATGHGTLGWTMAAGTGRVIADLVGGRPPAIDAAGLAPHRR